MAELHPNRNGAKNAAHVLLKQIDKAAAQLAHGRATDEQIHAVRKSLKKSRATLRLLREALPRTRYRQLNRSLRDAAVPLSALRDARVMVDTLDNLKKHYGGVATEVIPAEFRRILQAELHKIRRQVAGSSRGLRSTRTGLRASRRAVGELELSTGGWSVLGEGFRHTYKLGRDAMRTALASRRAEDLHEWRKQAKYLRYQLRVLQPLWPGLIEEWTEQVHHLSNYLGDDHDLSALRAKVLEHAQSFPERHGTAALLALIDRCQRRLQDQAIVLGGRVYSEKPAQITERLGEYWHRWKHGLPRRHYLGANRQQPAAL